MRRFYKNFFLAIFVTAVLFPANFVFGAEPLEVVINEIAWMGTEIDGVESKNWWRYEWIELYNTSEQKIDLSGWKIENGMAKQVVLEVSEGEILPQDYFLICKKKIANCDLEISKLSLHNDYKANGGLVLKDETENIIDQTPEPSNSDWPAGDNETKQTMERKDTELPGTDTDNWQTSRDSGGAPKAQNSQLPDDSPLADKIGRDPTSPVSGEVGSRPADEQPAVQQPVEPETIIYPSGVIINEILASPEGPDAENEWIEIFNQNNFEVELSGWKITDTIGTTKIYTFPKGTKISANGFLVLFRPETKITLNNSGDGLKLSQPDGKVIDEAVFGKAALGKSYNYFNTGWVWSDVPTPGSQNIIPDPELEQAGRDPFSPETGENGSRPNLASVSSPAQNLIDNKVPKPPHQNFWCGGKSFLPFLIASVLAIFSGAIIFLLKKNLKQQV